jgi:hypothetical protein
MSEYPKEDNCRKCGAHIGWIMTEFGEAVALGICDECRDESVDEDKNFKERG